jgi:GNAT superfamily N-acetyltransferase
MATNIRREADRIRLGDGSEIFVRPVRGGDKDRLASMTDALTEESRHRRYLGPKGHLSATDLQYLTEIDHHDHEALVALERPDGDAVGVARYIRLPGDARAAEAAVVVSDRWHRRGVASTLLRRLADHARENGIARFTGIVLSGNRATLELVEQLGTPRTTPDGMGTVAVEVDLPRNVPGERARRGLRRP